MKGISSRKKPKQPSQETKYHSEEDSQPSSPRSSSDSEHEHEHEHEHEGDKSSADDVLGSIMSKILGTATPASAETMPVLAKRKAVERQIEEERLEKRARALVRQELREKRDAAHKVPTMESANHEKILRKFATKGAVQLFNAVHQHQAAREKAAKAQQEAKKPASANSAPAKVASAEKDVKALSKASFLELLKMGGSSSATAKSRGT